MTTSGAAPLTLKMRGMTASLAVGADLTTPHSVVPFAGLITAVTFTAAATLTGANTDTRDISIVNKGTAGVGTTEVAMKHFLSGTNASWRQETAITVSVTPANVNVAEGDVLCVVSAHAGATGLADPGGLITITLDRD